MLIIMGRNQKEREWRVLRRRAGMH